MEFVCFGGIMCSSFMKHATSVIDCSEGTSLGHVGERVGSGRSHYEYEYE
jgi:hypothetical protein